MRFGIFVGYPLYFRSLYGGYFKDSICCFVLFGLFWYDVLLLDLTFYKPVFCSFACGFYFSSGHYLYFGEDCIFILFLLYPVACVLVFLVLNIYIYMLFAISLAVLFMLLFCGVTVCVL